MQANIAATVAAAQAEMRFEVPGVSVHAYLQELSKARDRLEKATAESTEMVFDSAVTALAKGLDKVVNEGKDTIPEGEDTEKFLVST